jgi:hypothetical protein
MGPFNHSAAGVNLGGDLCGGFGFNAREVVGDLQAQPDSGGASEIPGEAQRRFRHPALGRG